MTHDELMNSLTSFLRSEQVMVWRNLQLGPSGSPRPDVYTIRKSFSKPRPMAYEVKASISDFRSDVTSGKWMIYLNYAQGVYFAGESGLIGKDDLPNGCGLIVHKNSWRIAKKPTLQKEVAIPQDAMLKLLIDGVQREGPIYRARAWNDDAISAKVMHRFGKDVARAAHDLQLAKREISQNRTIAKNIIMRAEHEAETIRLEADVSLQREELCSILGLPKTADRWKIAGAVNKIRHEIETHPAIAELDRTMRALRRFVSVYDENHLAESR